MSPDSAGVFPVTVSFPTLGNGRYNSGNIFNFTYQMGVTSIAPTAGNINGADNKNSPHTHIITKYFMYSISLLLWPYLLLKECLKLYQKLLGIIPADLFMLFADQFDINTCTLLLQKSVLGVSVS